MMIPAAPDPTIVRLDHGLLGIVQPENVCHDSRSPGHLKHGTATVLVMVVSVGREK
jgi:hypothetical protein